MFGMKRLLPTLLSATLAVGMLTTFTACGSSSDDSKDTPTTTTDDTTTDGTTTVSYTGTQTLTGSVSLSRLSPEDTTAISSGTSTTSKRRVTAAGDAVVKLFVLDEKGDLKDTNLSCTIAADDSYTCPNIAGDKEYIVRYLKDIGNGKILEMKSTASVPATGTVPEVKVDPVTTMIAQAVMDAVEEAITGLVSDENLIRDIMASVKTAVETAVNTLISSGAIKVPSLVSEGTVETVAATKTTSTGLSEVSGTVLTDNTLSTTLNASKSAAVGAKLADLSSREKVQMIFDQMLKDGGAPGWMIEFIGDKWDGLDSTHTVTWLNEMLVDSIEVRTDELNWILHTEPGADMPAWVDTMAAEIESAVAAGLADAGTGSALATAIEGITEYHRIKAIAIANRTAAEVAYMGEFPSIVGELFPATFLADLDMTTQFDNTGQVTAYMIYVMDAYTREITGPIIDTYFTANNVELFGDMKEHIHLVDFSPEDLFLDLGFVAVAENYYGIYFDGWVDIRTDRIWINDPDTNMGEEKAMLKIETGIENPAWFMVDDAALSEDDFTAKLTYPTATGTKTVDMDIMVEAETYTEDGTDKTEYWVRLMVGPNWEGVDCSTGPCEPAINVDINDHVTGNYVITVTHDGATATKTIENVFILNNPRDYQPKLTSPKAYPQWPGENATDTEMDAFHAEEQAFWEQGITVFAPNNDDNTSLTNAIFKWKAPDLSALTLPENIGPRYQVGINLFEPQDADSSGDISEEEKNNCYGENWDECNTEIFNTWWDNRAVKGTSFNLPVELPVNSESGEYNIHVNLVFIDKNTGREVAVGGDTFANFKVGVVEVLDDATDINFTGSITLEDGKTLPDWIDTAKLKVALLAESNSYNEDTGNWDWTTDIIADANVTIGEDYTLSTDVGTVKAALAEKKWINLILFVDANDDGEWTPWTPDAQEDAEDAFWMHDRWFWFENFGEFRVGSDGGDAGFSSQKVSNGGITVTDMDFENPFIWEEYVEDTATASVAVENTETDSN